MIETFLQEHGYYSAERRFSELTTLKMGGAIRHYVEPYSFDDIKDIIAYLKANGISFKVIGNGSNLACGSHIYEGVAISLKRLNTIEINNDEVYVEAGVLGPYLATVLANQGLSGFEFAGGIPGTIGGMVYMNAGAYKKDMSSIVQEVIVLKKDEIVTLTNAEMEFAYRHSLLQEHPRWVALACKLKLEYGDTEIIKNLMSDRLQRRLSSQPLDKPSAGSCFRNPEGHFAWQLIDELGYRGKCHNGVMVSEKHPNFLINKDNGTAEDYLALALDIQQKVQEKYQLKLIMEVEKFNC